MTASSVKPKRFNAITSTGSNAAIAGHSPLTFSQLDKLTSSIVNITSSSSLLPPSPSQHAGLRLLQELFELSVPTHTNAQQDHVNKLANYKQELFQEKERNEEHQRSRTKESSSHLLSLPSESILRKHGFPTRDRLATSFAAAQKHSAEGALLQLFAEGIARLFSGETCEVENYKPNTPTELKYRQNLGDSVESNYENKNKPSDIHQVKEQVCRNLAEENNECRYEENEYQHQHTRDYENNYITRMFDNLQSTAGFASEWEQTLKECVRANSSLQAHLYELQGFGVLYSYIWSQTAMLVALMHKMQDSDNTTLAEQLQKRESAANKSVLESALYKNEFDCNGVDKCNTDSNFAAKSNNKGNNMMINTTTTTSSTKNNSHDIDLTSDKMQQESKNWSEYSNQITSDNNNMINGSKNMQHRLPLKVKFASLPDTTSVHVQSLASPITPVSLIKNNAMHDNRQTHTSNVLENHISSDKKEETKVYTPRLAVHSHALSELTKMKRKYAQLSNSPSSSSSSPLTLPIHGLQPNINNCIGDEQVNSTTNIHISNNNQEYVKGISAMTQSTLKNRWVSPLPFVRDTKHNSSTNNNSNDDDNKHCLHNREQVHDIRTGNSSQAQEIKTYMSQLRAMMDE